MYANCNTLITGGHTKRNIIKRVPVSHRATLVNRYSVCVRGTDIEKVKKDAPIVGLTFLGNTFPTCRMMREVFPTPERETVHT